MEQYKICKICRKKIPSTVSSILKHTEEHAEYWSKFKTVNDFYEGE
jgi:hypothetical protein